MSDHWQNGPSGPPHDPSHDPSYGYGDPASGHGSQPHQEPGYGPEYYNPGAYPPGPYGAPPPPQFLPAPPYFVRQPDRTSAVIALVVSIIMLFMCWNPLGIGGLIFAAVSMSEAQDHDRAARHARYAWYCVIAGIALVVLLIGFVFTMSAIY